MVYDFLCNNNKLYNDQRSNQVIGLHLGLSTVDCYPYILPMMLDNSTASSLILQLAISPASWSDWLLRTINEHKDIAGSCEKEEALRLVYEICPHIQFGHFVANSSILEAFEGESFVHVVDLGMTLGLLRGHQWCRLIESLANRASRPPRRLRITAVGLCVDKFQRIGDALEDYAKTYGINLEFSVVESSMENLQTKDIKVLEIEVLVVNSILQLHCVVKESRGALNLVLVSPKVLVLVEQDSRHNGVEN